MECDPVMEGAAACIHSICLPKTYLGGGGGGELEGEREREREREREIKGVLMPPKNKDCSTVCVCAPSLLPSGRHVYGPQFGEIR